MQFLHKKQSIVVALVDPSLPSSSHQYVSAPKDTLATAILQSDSTSSIQPTPNFNGSFKMERRFLPGIRRVWDFWNPYASVSLAITQGAAPKHNHNSSNYLLSYYSKSLREQTTTSTDNPVTKKQQHRVTGLIPTTPSRKTNVVKVSCRFDQLTWNT